MRARRRRRARAAGSAEPAKGLGWPTLRLLSANRSHRHDHNARSKADVQKCVALTGDVIEARGLRRVAPSKLHSRVLLAWPLRSWCSGDDLVRCNQPSLDIQPVIRHLLGSVQAHGYVNTERGQCGRTWLR
jgi:hypothetical protein